MKSIENILKEYIVKKFKSVKAFASKIDVNYTTVDNILKKGIKTGNSFTIFKICECLSIDFYALMNGEMKEYIPPSFVLTSEEKTLIETYNSLDEYGKDAVNFILNVEYKQKKHYNNIVNYVQRSLLSLPVAAGYGDENGEVEEIPVRIWRNRYSEICDYVIRVDGDSMEPVYSDGDFVMVRKDSPVDVGEVGIFTYQNENFIKTLGKNALISENPSYPPIVIAEPDRFYICGKVLAKAEKLEYINQS